jgi:hypothetical protein
MCHPKAHQGIFGMGGLVFCLYEFERGKCYHDDMACELSFSVSKANFKLSAGHGG